MEFDDLFRSNFDLHCHGVVVAAVELVDDSISVGNDDDSFCMKKVSITWLEKVITYQ